uniref:Uncharacterized protein n=1 Tax=Talaromyces marneffei PM1 TaxID=1077442 RepID=A0A093VT45_TALMA
MPEGKKRPAPQDPTTNGFDPLDIFKAQSSNYSRLPEHIKLIEDHLGCGTQADTGFQLYDIFVSKKVFATWVFVVIVQDLSKGSKAITEHTVFDVNLKASSKEKNQWSTRSDSFTDVPLVDIVKCDIDGKPVVVGLLCIPVEIRLDESLYSPNRKEEWFQDLSQDTKAGVRVQRRDEVRDEDMPFNHISDLNTNYVFALEYGWKKAAEKTKLVQVTTRDPTSTDEALALFPETFLRQDKSCVFLLIRVAHRDNEKSPMTTDTPFTINLTIRKGPEEKKLLVKPYNNEISVKPTGVDATEGFIYGLLIVSIPQKNREEIQFFEEAFKDQCSIDVSYVLTRHR